MAVERDVVETEVRWKGNKSYRSEAERLSKSTRSFGAAQRQASVQTRAAQSALWGYERSVGAAGKATALVGSQVRYGTIGLLGFAAAGVKMGLSFNAQVESARLRFKLFTDDVAGLTQAVQGIDAKSAFNFGELSDAAALLGNAGVRNIPKVLQAAANAAAASGKGSEGFQRTVLALSQIQSKGRLSQEEINQLNEAGAPGAQRTIQKAFKLTAKQVGNLGNVGIDADKAISALTDEWTSGRMAKAAEEQTKTLAGQWDMLKGNVQKLSGAMTVGLSKNLAGGLLPTLNRLSLRLNDIFSTEGLSDATKVKLAGDSIRRLLRPTWESIKKDIERANIPQKIADALNDAIPYVVSQSGSLGLKAATTFAEAWWNAGAWSKIFSAALIAKKVGLGGVADSLVKKVLGGVGGKVPGVKNIVGPNGSATSPFYVIAVNGGLPGTGSKVGNVAKKAAPAAGFLARNGAKIGGGAAGALALGGILYLATTHNENLPTKGVGGSSPSNPDGHAGFDPGAMSRRQVTPLVTRPEPQTSNAATQALANGGSNEATEIHNYLYLDGKQLAVSTDKQVRRKKARK